MWAQDLALVCGEFHGSFFKCLVWMERAQDSGGQPWAGDHVTWVTEVGGGTGVGWTLKCGRGGIRSFFFLQLIDLFLTVLGLCCCTQAFSGFGVRASHCGGFSCCGARASVIPHGLSSLGSPALMHRLNSCGA